MTTSTNDNEKDLRLLDVFRRELLDTNEDAEFDALAQAAALVCEAPVAIINLNDSDQHWIRSAYGLVASDDDHPEREFCRRVIDENAGFLEIADALGDQQLAANPLVYGPTGMRFFAGVSVRPSIGLPLGAVCVLDSKPRSLTSAQRNGLNQIATGVETLIASRRRNWQLVRRLTNIYTETPALLYLLDPTGAVVEVSDLFLEHFGYQRCDVLGRNGREFMTPGAQMQFNRVREDMWGQGGCRNLPSQFRKADGQIVDVLISAAVEFGSNGVPVRVKCVLTDVTEQLALQQTLERRARTDELTGLSNRGWFRERVQVESDRARRYERPLALVVFDADHFKYINDKYGHAAGDCALRALAMLAPRRLRTSDEVGRIGGEEFAILLPETDMAGAQLVAERLRFDIEQLDWDAHNVPSPVTVSVGVAVAEPGAGLSVDDLFAHADSAMYAAKQAGRNKVMVFEAQRDAQDSVLEQVKEARVLTPMRHDDDAKACGNKPAAGSAHTESMAI